MPWDPNLQKNHLKQNKSKTKAGDDLEMQMSNVQNPVDIPLYWLFNRDPS